MCRFILLLTLLFTVSCSTREAPPSYQTSGLAIQLVEKGSFLEKLGLKDRDVVTQVNGKPLPSRGTAEAFYDQMKTTDRIELTIWRDGKAVTLKYKAPKF